MEATNIIIESNGTVIYILSLILCFTFLILALIHFNWAIGGTWGMDAALPTKENGERLFSPRKIDSAAVGFALFAFSALYLIKSGIVTFGLNQIASYTYWVIPSIFTLRAIGDFKYAGLFKKIKTTEFSKADSKIYTPLCILLALLGFIIVSF